MSVDRTMRFTVRAVVLGVAGLALAGQAGGAGAQQPGAPQAPSAPSRGGQTHGEHRTAEGWKFPWPKGGDPAKGREAFAKFECYSCHEVKGEKFLAPAEKGKIGPELSAMGPLHPPEYFAEAVIDPSATIESGKSYEAPDGSSKMPSFNDSVTVQELIDLVAYLRALKPPGGTPAGHTTH